MTKTLVSDCGHYVSHAEEAHFTIHRVLPAFQLRRYNCDIDVQKHLNLPFSNDRTVKVECLRWESVSAHNKSTKIAVSVSSKEFNAVLIYDITATRDPVIIELQSAIANVSWILGAPEEGSAYKNCTQLVLFDEFGLLASVYSLDCTRVLFDVPKPMILRVLNRPKHPGFWSLLLSFYYDKNLASRSILTDLQSDSHPCLLHFRNTGSISAPLTSLELDHLPSPSAQIAWDPTGNWLCFFDSEESLFGYTLRVYNSLGVYKRPSSLLESHLALPAIYSTHNKGISWTFSWLKNEDLLFLAAIPSKSGKKLEFRIHGVSYLAHCYKSVVNLSKSDAIWVYEDFNGEVSYRRTEALPEAEFEWKTIRDYGRYLVLATGKVLAILKRDSQGPLVKFEPEAYISSLQLRDVQFYKNSIILLFQDHVAIYDDGSLSIVATSGYSLISLRVTENLGARVITIVEQTPQGPTLRQVGQGDVGDSILLLNDLSYKEESSKVVKLVKEVRNNTRPRFTDDTDTFKLRFKRRRPPGLPELH